MILENKLSKFYFLIWMEWFIRLTLSSLIFSFVVSMLITLYIYVNQGMLEFDSEVYKALFSIFKFWFAPLWSLGILVFLYRGLKDIFNKCRGGYELVLDSCENSEDKGEVIELVGLGDITKVWRKYFMLIIWLVAAQMIIAVAFSKLFTSWESLFDWFDIYILYGFIVIAGYFSFMILSNRCKRVRIRKC